MGPARRTSQTHRGKHRHTERHLTVPDSRTERACFTVSIRPPRLAALPEAESLRDLKLLLSGCCTPSQFSWKPNALVHMNPSPMPASLGIDPTCSSTCRLSSTRPSGDRAFPCSIFHLKTKLFSIWALKMSLDAYYSFQTCFKIASTPSIIFHPPILLFLVRCVLFCFHAIAPDQTRTGRPCFCHSQLLESSSHKESYFPVRTMPSLEAAFLKKAQPHLSMFLRVLSCDLKGRWWTHIWETLGLIKLIPSPYTARMLRPFYGTHRPFKGRKRRFLWVGSLRV